MPRRAASDFGVPTGTAQRLTPPADLGGPERQVFLSVVLAMPASHFHPGDIHLVVAYAGAVVRERVASGELAAAGYVTGDGKPSAWCSVLKDAIRDITQGCCGWLRYAAMGLLWMPRRSRFSSA